MKSFRSNIFNIKKKKPKSSIKKRFTKYLFRCSCCGAERRFAGFLDAYRQGYYLPQPVYCPNSFCGITMDEIDISIPN